MIGGKVIEIVWVASKIWVNCKESVHHEGILLYETTCAIYIERSEASEQIKLGDYVWWQGDKAMWTPRPASRKQLVGLTYGVDYDIPLKKIGNSGAYSPAQLMIERAYKEEECYNE